MYILTRSNGIENKKNKSYEVRNAKLEEQYQKAGYNRHNRTYVIKIKHNVYQIVCPEFRNDAKGLKPIVIIPDFIIPGRPYPVYVYLYGMALYSKNTDKGQRWAAEKTRKEFGLTTFAHTTLGRAMKAFNKVIKTISAANIGDVDKVIVSKNNAREFPSVKATTESRKDVIRFLKDVLTRAVSQHIISCYCCLARKIFIQNMCFLL